MRVLANRIGIWMFVLFGLICLVSLLQKNFVYW
jgi:hypothetical protein